jgi:hypothetical protein
LVKRGLAIPLAERVRLGGIAIVLGERHQCQSIAFPFAVLLRVSSLIRQEFYEGEAIAFRSIDLYNPN